MVYSSTACRLAILREEALQRAGASKQAGMRHAARCRSISKRNKPPPLQLLPRSSPPRGSRPVIGLLERFGRGKLHAKLDMKGDDKSPVTDAQLALNGDLDDLRIDARVRASGDWARPSTANIRVDAALDAARSAQLLKFMNLDRMVAAGNGPGQLKIQLAGPVNGDMTFDTQLVWRGPVCACERNRPLLRRSRDKGHGRATNKRSRPETTAVDNRWASAAPDEVACISRSGDDDI